MQGVLRDLGVVHRVFVTRRARCFRLVPHRRARLTIAVHRGGLVTRRTFHLEFGVVRVAGNEIIVAEKFIADARAVTSRTGVLDRRFFAGGMPCQESAARERGAADVALPASAVTLGAVIVERFFQDGRVHICANGFEVRPIAVLIDVQTRRGGLHLFIVTKRARLVRMLARLGDHVLVRGFFVCCRAISGVTSDATQFAVR